MSALMLAIDGSKVVLKDGNGLLAAALVDRDRNQLFYAADPTPAERERKQD